jgi:osmoprotectant transport system ATP-binding protein
MVEFRGAVYGVDGREILRGLSLGVEQGETVALLGRSGSGKTTALKMVNALLLPSAGQVLVEGRPTAAWDPVRLRRGIGYVIQDVGLFPHYSVARNVELVPRLEGWPPDRIQRRTRELLELVGLPLDVYGGRRPRELSGGERQRIGIARALAADPPILLFDEPFGALDPVTRLDLQNQFLALQRELRKTSIFVTHDIGEALRLANRIALLKDGRVETLAAPREFLRSNSEEARTFLECLPLLPKEP